MRKVLVSAVAVVLLAALAACTPAQRLALSNLGEGSPPADATWAVDAACESIALTTSGYPDGTTVEIWTEGQTNIGAVVNTAQTFRVPAAAADENGEYEWTVWITEPEQAPAEHRGSHDGCTPNARCG